MPESNKARLTHPNCIFAEWFDPNGDGPFIQFVNGQPHGCDLQAEWFVGPLGPRVAIASTQIGGLYMAVDDAREFAARMVLAADLAELRHAKTGGKGRLVRNVDLGVVWDSDQDIGRDYLESHGLEIEVMRKIVAPAGLTDLDKLIVSYLFVDNEWIESRSECLYIRVTDPDEIEYVKATWEEWIFSPKHGAHYIGDPHTPSDERPFCVLAVIN